MPKIRADNKKMCSSCGQLKEREEYHAHCRMPDGLAYQCKRCKNATNRTWHRKNYKENHEKELRRRREYYYRNQEEISKRRKVLRNKDPSYNKKQVARTHKMTVEEWDLLFEEQNCLCAICKSDFENSVVHTDHDHKTGVVRGLLCRECNLMIGHARERTDILLDAAQYLERHNGNKDNRGR